MSKEFTQRLNEAIELRQMTSAELCRKTGISSALMSMYRRGKSEAKQSQLYRLAVALDVSEAWLMGFDAPMPRGIRPSEIETQSVPLLGEISCGQPILASETFEAYVQVGANLHCDFCLRARGDSMTGARIYDGDIVFIRKQSIVENGEIAAVVINDEATLKRVFLSEGKLVLQAENPAYAPLVYVGEELNSVRILGKAIAFQSDVR